jgi:SAM-dependent methyltransferase
MLVLNPQQLEGTRRALLGTQSAELIELVFRLDLHQALDGIDASALERARELGWVQAGVASLTPVGWLVADSLREYRFWIDRGRRLHAGDSHAELAPERYAGKSVLEPGSGFGCNLLSLSRVHGRFVGLEPVAVYRQLTPILAEREGLPVPEVVDGRCEALPFKDAEFDVVLCYSAHQYMDVRVALREMARVLRPGGQLQIIGGTLGVFAWNYGKRVATERRLGLLKHYLLTVGNTLAYQWLGRRLFVPHGASATTAPVYPAVGAMRRWMAEAGLSPRDDVPPRVGGETCFFADKPNR